MKTFVALFAVVAPLALGGAASVDAQERIDVVATSDLGICDRDVPVCGVVSHDRMVSFRNECQAHDAGASHVIVGPCFDEE